MEHVATAPEGPRLRTAALYQITVVLGELGILTGLDRSQRTDSCRENLQLPGMHKTRWSVRGLFVGLNVGQNKNPHTHTRTNVPTVDQALARDVLETAGIKLPRH